MKDELETLKAPLGIENTKQRRPSKHIRNIAHIKTMAAAAAVTAAAAAVQQWLVQLKGHQQWNQGDTGSS